MSISTYIYSVIRGRSLEGSWQEGRQFFYFFFAKLYTLQTQQRLAPSISQFSAAAINVLRQTLITTTDQGRSEHKFCLARFLRFFLSCHNGNLRIKSGW
jgi:hypothetical protein